MKTDPTKKKKIIISKDGPYLISGKIPLRKEIIETDEDGYSYKWKVGEKYPEQENYSLCRCGKSKNMPFCDGNHVASSFDGTETASRKKFSEQAEKISGPELDLLDAIDYCASARFCDRQSGIWNLVENSNDPEAKRVAIEQACNCSSGRLVVVDKKTKKPIEAKLEKSLSLTEDPRAGVSGPIWVKGGVEIESADGKSYEVRNRVTLCRCGKSRNMPFCDTSHVPTSFNDGDKSIN
jgi:CDGSH-type Zn-finger protein